MPEARPTKTPPTNCFGNLMVYEPCGWSSGRLVDGLHPPRPTDATGSHDVQAAGPPPPLTTGLSQPPSRHGLEPKTFQNRAFSRRTAPPLGSLSPPAPAAFRLLRIRAAACR